MSQRRRQREQMSKFRENAADYVGRFMREAATAGLTWDEAVAVFGVAVAAGSFAEATQTEDSNDKYLIAAKIVFEEAVSQNERVERSR
jgi:hypothetical protein